ncbi:cell-division control histidine kinase PdhS [Stappia sp. 22II-S9-Z10]|nr:cell-division control histidine kinase PdhS [Stappia sp. 22II-S9-Z10]
MESDAPIDVGRMSRPEADAFRYIAKALGAQFAGDIPAEAERAPLASLGSDVLVRPWDKPRGSMLDVAVPDPKASSLIERMPVACLVIVNDEVAFINRAAVVLFGYTSANILEAAGGVGALFSPGGPERPGVMAMKTAAAQVFGAKVTMATIEWGGEAGMLLTAIPAETVETDARARPSPRTIGADSLIPVLDANPDPVAIVTRGGHVEVCNRAFEMLAEAGDKVRLEDRVGAADLEHLFDVMKLSFMLADGQARTTKPVRAGHDHYTVSVGALRQGRLACLVFHRRLAADSAHPPHRAGALPMTAAPANAAPPSGQAHAATAPTAHAGTAHAGTVHSGTVHSGTAHAGAAPGGGLHDWAIFDAGAPDVRPGDTAAREAGGRMTGGPQLPDGDDAGATGARALLAAAAAAFPPGGDGMDGPAPSSALASAPSCEPGGTALYRAVSEVRRLVKDTAVLIVSDDNEVAARPGIASAKEAELIRIVLLTVAARGHPSAVLTVRRCGASTIIEAPGTTRPALERVAQSDRIADLAVEAGCRVTVDPSGTITITAEEVDIDAEASEATVVQFFR